MNLSNLAGTTDAALDQVDLNPSKFVKDGINGAADHVERMRWRLTAAGR